MGFLPDWKVTPESFDYLNPVALSRYSVAGHPGWTQVVSVIVNTVFSQLSFSDISESGTDDYDFSLNVVVANLENDVIDNDAVAIARVVLAALDEKYPGRISEIEEKPFLENQSKPPRIDPENREPDRTPSEPETPTELDGVPILPRPSRLPVDRLSEVPAAPPTPISDSPETPKIPAKPSGDGIQVPVKNRPNRDRLEDLKNEDESNETSSERDSENTDRPVDEDVPEEAEGKNEDEPAKQVPSIIDYTLLENAIFNALSRSFELTLSNPPIIRTRPADLEELTDSDIKGEMKSQMQNIIDVVDDFRFGDSQSVVKSPSIISTPFESEES